MSILRLVCALAGRGKLEQETIGWDQAAQGREQSLKMDILCRAEHMQRLMSQIDCGAKIVQGLVTQTDTLQQGMDYLVAALAQASASKGAGILSYGCERAAAERDRSVRGWEKLRREYTTAKWKAQQRCRCCCNRKGFKNAGI